MSEESSARFRVGQVWRYKTRPQEPESVLTIVRIDALPLGAVIHISVNNVVMKNRFSKNGLSETIRHMPFTEAAIEASVDRLIAEKAELPPYEEGYKEWKKAKGGVFTLSVSEAIDAMEQAVRPQHH